MSKGHPVSSRGQLLALAILAAIGGAGCGREHGAVQGSPAKTVKAATVFPEIGQYEGKPLELGRIEPTVSRFAAR